jgi:hypothetical protein
MSERKDLSRREAIKVIGGLAAVAATGLPEAKAEEAETEEGCYNYRFRKEEARLPCYGMDECPGKCAYFDLQAISDYSGGGKAARPRLAREYPEYVTTIAEFVD